eukprot:SAG25_NODE_801_length_5268_cov_3.548849_2_plen_69_part_00
MSVSGLTHIIESINAEDKLLLVDDVFDSGNTIKAVIETIKAKARRNAPEIRTGAPQTAAARGPRTRHS